MREHDADETARAADAHAFLTALYGAAPAGYWFGVMRKADGRRGNAFGRGEWRSVKPVSLLALAHIAVRWRSDVYVNVAPSAVEPPIGRRNKTATTAALLCLWHELDGDGAAERLAELEAVVGRASIVVSSGGGLHAYWLLAAPVVGAEAIGATLKAWRARIVLVLGDGAGDDVQDAARILRVPGTFNAKPERRDASGNAPTVRLLRCDAGQRYAAAELAPPLLDVEPQQPDARKAAGPRPAGVTPYGAGALASAYLEIAERKPETGRWVDMRRQVFRLGQIAERHGLDADAVAADIMRACDVNGLVDERGAAEIRRTISAVWAGGLAAPSDRGTDAGTAAAYEKHAARVDGWRGTALTAARELSARTRDTARAVVSALECIARAAGPTCATDGWLVVDASRDRLAMLTGYTAQTCRKVLDRLIKLGIVEIVHRGGLRGYEVRVKLARKVANTYGLKCADELDAAEPVPVRHRGNDALVAAFGPKGAAILRELLAAAPLTSRELAACVGCSRPTADDYVGRLVSAGVVKEDGKRPNRKGAPSPLYVAAVASEAEAIAVSGAEHMRARLLARRADDWSRMTARANATAGHYHKQKELEDAIGPGVERPDGVAAFAAEIRAAPLSDGAIMAGKRAAEREALDALAAQHAALAAPDVDAAAEPAGAESGAA